MDITLTLKAIIMGLVEGFTEFLPISSTGHLILAGNLLDFTANISHEKAQVFDIAIQIGAILAVCWEYRLRIANMLFGFSHDAKARKLIGNLIVAFIPAALLGLMLGQSIKLHLFAPLPVALALIVGGCIILWIEHRHKRHPHSQPKIASIDHISLRDAFKVGLFQACALIPGTSRSGATIMGSMLLGMSRQAATEFSFFLAIPTLFAAALYSLYKERALLSLHDLPLFSIGTVAAFVSAFICIRWLLRYVSNHDFTAFAWYRIGFGLVIIASNYAGWVNWTH